MVEWKLEDGIIRIITKDGRVYYPVAKEIFSFKKKDTVAINGVLCPNPSSALGFRLSGIGLRSKLYFNKKDKDITADLVIVRNDKEFLVPILNNIFLDYIIIDNVWHYINANVSLINSILTKYSIVPSKITYHQYMDFTRELVTLGIDFSDKVVSEVESIKNSPYKFYTVGLKGRLFNYQDCGCHWLSFMTDNQCGSILGDEMGLGKTLQIIALLGSEKSKRINSHFLVICPVSLLENWRREIEKFYPSLHTYIHHGPNRTGDYTTFLNYDIVISSYSNVQSDLSIFNMVNWNIVVIDEAQNIKNPQAQRTKAIKRINKDVAIAVTGTPFENHMTDIWSIVDFVMPGYLGKLSEFEKYYQDNISSASSLEKLITPIMIRRRVKDVAKDLPERVDIPQPIEMTEEEAMFYESERNRHPQLSDLKSMKLNVIQGLRMFCTHPLVYNKTLKEKDPTKTSNKYQRLCEILGEIFENKEKAIIFTSFNGMINILVTDIQKRFGVYTNYINGSINASTRQNIVDEFSNHNGPAALILNPRAAGTGLNITAANHVIHYNLEWNPAIEDQASARAYRRGQEKTVFVHRLFYANTIEEIINERIQRKRSLSETAVVGNEGEMNEEKDLLRALSISPFKVK